MILILGGTFSVARGLPPEQGYAALLQKRLAAEKEPLSILNASVAGETAAGASERLRHLLGSPLKQAVLELGQADEERGTPPRQFSRDVKKLLRHIRTRQPGLPILLLPSTRTPAYYEPLAAAAKSIDGLTLSELLVNAPGVIRPEDTSLHRRLAEELGPLLGIGQ